tara:strand:+ start:334 stop:636 length:303 start_codon:yes stop_codon:yes gene_type:complete
MDRCEYCGRILNINRSDKYLLCSKKCKQKFKNKIEILSTNKFVLNSVNKEWIPVKNIVSSNKNKFEIVSSISRLIYFEKKLIKKEKGEINLKTNVSIKKR